MQCSPGTDAAIHQWIVLAGLAIISLASRAAWKPWQSSLWVMGMDFALVTGMDVCSPRQIPVYVSEAKTIRPYHSPYHVYIGPQLLDHIKACIRDY